jgi:hypothetical protein
MIEQFHVPLHLSVHGGAHGMEPRVSNCLVSEQLESRYFDVALPRRLGFVALLLFDTRRTLTTHGSDHVPFSRDRQGR